MHSPLLLLWGLENCFEITLKECWKVPVCKKKQQRSILFDTEQKEDWKKVKEQVKLLCSWWLCLVLHSPLLLLWGPEKCRNVTECWKVPVRKKKAKRNIVWHRAQRGLERNFCPASAMSVSVVRASSNLIVSRRRTHGWRLWSTCISLSRWREWALGTGIWSWYWVRKTSLLG